MFRQAKWFLSVCWGTGQSEMRRKCNSNMERFVNFPHKSQRAIWLYYTELPCNRLRDVIANGIVLVALSCTSHKIAIYKTISQCSLIYKRIQPDGSGVRLWCFCSHTSQRSWARAPGEEEEKEKDEMWEMSWKFSTRCRVFTRKTGK